MGRKQQLGFGREAACPFFHCRPCLVHALNGRVIGRPLVRAVARGPVRITTAATLHVKPGEALGPFTVMQRWRGSADEPLLHLES